MQLEEFGFCGPGEAADFVAERRLPLNTHGGQLGEAYLHGMNGIAEAVRQVRGTAVNQIAGRRHGAGHGGDRRPHIGSDSGSGRLNAGCVPGPVRTPAPSLALCTALAVGAA